MRVAAALVALAFLAGCGAPDEMSGKDTATLTTSREALEDALKTEAELRSPAKTRRILREVQRLIATGSFETKELDEFGLAALGELQLVLPSVVETDRDGVPVTLDRPALRVFRRYAASDPRRALHGPVAEEVDRIERVIKDAGADDETKVRNQTVGQYVRGVQRDVRPVWPALAVRLSDVP